MGPKDMRMFYHSFDSSKQKWTIGTANSKDGFVWKKAGPIFAGSDSGADFDGKGAAACHVVRDFQTKRYAATTAGSRIVDLGSMVHVKRHATQTCSVRASHDSLLSARMSIK